MITILMNTMKNNFRMRQRRDNIYKEDWPEWEETERREFLEDYSSSAYGFKKENSRKREFEPNQEER